MIMKKKIAMMNDDFLRIEDLFAEKVHNEFISILKQLLEFNPNSRINAS